MPIYGFNREVDAERAVELARETVAIPGAERPSQESIPQPLYLQSRLAKTDGSGITARSGTTAGSGTVTLQYLDGTTITAGSDTVTVYNWVAEAGAANTYVWVAQDSFGTWWFRNEDCSGS